MGQQRISWEAKCIWARGQPASGMRRFGGPRLMPTERTAYLERSLKPLSLSINNLYRELPWLKFFTGHMKGTVGHQCHDCMAACYPAHLLLQSYFYDPTELQRDFLRVFALLKLRHCEQRVARENHGLKIRQQELLPASCGNSQPCYSVFLPGTGTYWPQRQCQKSQVHIPM